MSMTVLAACGTVTPDIQEFWGTPEDAQIRVNAIIAQVRCELRAAVRSAIYDDIRFSRFNKQPRRLVWLENWLAQVTLTLDVAEKSSVSPSLSVLDQLNRAGTKTFTAALGGSYETGATRTDSFQQLYSVREFLQSPGPDGQTCKPTPVNANLFVHSDLKIKEWLYTIIMPVQVGTAQFPADLSTPLQQDVITHQVEFQIVTSGSFNPTWTLVDVNVNSAVPLLSASRDRKQTLLITMGPSQGPAPVLSVAAQNLDLAAQIRTAIAAGVAERRP
jgi:hypothetical protein